MQGSHARGWPQPLKSWSGAPSASATAAQRSNPRTGPSLAHASQDPLDPDVSLVASEPRSSPYAAWSSLRVRHQLARPAALPISKLFENGQVSQASDAARGRRQPAYLFVTPPPCLLSCTVRYCSGLCRWTRQDKTIQYNSILNRPSPHPIHHSSRIDR